jgi:hypothetical protein
VIYRALMGVAMALYTVSACAAERIASLVNSFQVFCTLELLDFAALDAKATGDEMKVELMKNVSADGQRVAVWRKKMGSDDVTVMLAGPASTPGFHLTLMQELPAGR